LWVGIILGAIVLGLLLVFVLQNTRSVRVSFFSASGAIPLGAALVFAALGGVLLSAVAASLRILQIRRRLGADPQADDGLPARAGTAVEPSRQEEDGPA
jgi:uncharacterized integral membrane protein